MNSHAAGIDIRRMGPADADEVIALATCLRDAPHWPLAIYLAALEPSSAPRRMALVAVGEASESVVGFAVASLLGAEAELEAIAVAEHSQRQGVGHRLWAAIAQELCLAGVREVRLEVRASNLPALGLYRALGFVQTGRRPRYYADPVEDAVLMNLRLG